jgi:hypothetical protein
VSQVGSVPMIGQIHDYSPGTTDSGLFWTIAVPPEAVQFDPDLQSSSYRQIDVEVLDAYNLVNSLADGPDEPGIVSFDVNWTATGPLEPVRHQDHGFVGEFREAQVTVSWSGSTASSSYTSEPRATSQSIFGFIGRERNGVFFT